MNKIDWKPTTLDECMKALSEILSPEEQMQVVAMSEKELSSTHHGLGQWIRNHWDLWKGGPLMDNMRAMGFKHPDDVSGSIIREWWSRMNNLPSYLQEDLKRYDEHWKKYGGV